MQSEVEVAQQWTPKPGGSWKNFVGKCLSFPCYPFILPFAVLSHGDSTVANARWFARAFTLTFFGTAALGHGWLYRRFSGQPSRGHILGQMVWLLTNDLSWVYMWMISHSLIHIFSLDRSESRVLSGRLHGPRVLVVGNGPSAMEGKQLGEVIDQFDEVVRFNNFQNRIAGMEKWVGSKTTVHFSDGVLYPTYTNYHVKGADVVLSLFIDRYMVSGSYLILRAGADLEIGLTKAFFYDPTTVWIPKEHIERMKKELGLTFVKHPTSGMLAIDFFLQQKDVQLPVYIHGFDFFQGPKIHYYNDHEPFYERVNNRIGVLQHSPDKEKIYVEKLVKEGKVKFLSSEY